MYQSVHSEIWVLGFKFEATPIPENDVLNDDFGCVAVSCSSVPLFFLRRATSNRQAAVQVYTMEEAYTMGEEMKKLQEENKRLRSAGVCQ